MAAKRSRSASVTFGVERRMAPASRRGMGGVTPSIFSSIFWMDGDSGLASSWVPQRLNSMGGVGSD